MRFIFPIIFLFIFVELLFPENILKNIDENVAIGGFLVIESEISEDQYINGDPENLPFIAYDNKKLPKNSEIKNRVYTFRTSFYIDEKLKDKDVSLYIGPSEYPYRIYVNGMLLGMQGRYGGGFYNSASIYSSNLVLSNGNLNFGETKNELAILLYPQYEQNPLMGVVISGYYKNSAAVFWRNLFNIHLVQASIIVALLISFYFLFLLFSRKNKEFKYLYFSLICVFFFLGYLNITFMNDSFNEILFMKLARSGQLLAALFFAIFILEFTGIFNKRLLKTIMIAVGVISAVVFFMQGSKEHLQNAFNFTNKIVIIPAMLFIIFITITAVVKRKNLFNLMILLGVVAIVFTSVRDITLLGNDTTPYCWFVPYGFLFLIIDLFFILALEQSLIYKESLASSVELNEKNKSVTSIIRQIGIVSDNLRKSGGELEINIQSLQKTFKEYEATNKGIVERILTEFKGIETLIGKISGRIDSSSDRMPKAIQSQTAVVEETSATLMNMNKNIDSIMNYVLKTNEVSKTLSDLASQSAGVVIKSKNSIGDISGHSQFINNVLMTIEDIAEKTNLLSINASIESARAGNTGKGFAVVSHEIRELARKSKESLTTSFSKIKEMHTLVDSSESLSEEVSNALFHIIEKSKSTFEMMETITGLFKEQKAESDSVIEGTKSLLLDTLSIKELTDEESVQNHEIKKNLSQFSESFRMIADLLKTQIENEKNIHGVIENINSVLSNNLKNVEMLNETMNLT